MRRVLFLDRGGTLVVEPKGGPMDALDNLRLVPGVIPALLRFKTACGEFGPPSPPWFVTITN